MGKSQAVEPESLEVILATRTIYLDGRSVKKADDASCIDTSMHFMDMPSNYVRTAKFSCWNFVPLCLILQFRRMLNIYFLFVCVLQTIPAISNTAGLPTMALPLSFVLLVSLLKEGYEDYLRHKQDKEINTRPTTRWCRTTQLWETVEWQDVEVADIIQVSRDDEIPADMVLLKSSREDRLAFVKTMNLDGETNLKRRNACSSTCNCEEMELGCLPGAITAEAPSKIMHTFSGTISLSQNDEVESPTSQTPLQMDNLLLRGSTLKNTTSAIGIVIYTGPDTRVIMNSAPAPSKLSRMERLTNRIVIYIILLQFVLCVSMSVSAGVWHSASSDEHWYLQMVDESGAYGIKKYFTGMILLMGMVPISLIVTLEILKFLQRFMMMTDLRMYHEENDQPFMPRTTSLNEELGQIDYVFSDKTGTLTRNCMDFKCCWVAGKLYGTTGEAPKGQSRKDLIMEGIPHVAFNDTNILKDLQHGDESLREAIHRFVLSMAVCHTVSVSIEDDPPPRALKGPPSPGTPSPGSSQENARPSSRGFDPRTSMTSHSKDGQRYEAESPDENAFVWAANALGYEFRNRALDGEGYTAEVVVQFKDTEEPQSLAKDSDIISPMRIHQLQTLEFTSDRACMSIIVKVPDAQNGEVELWTKGADSKILPRLDPQWCNKHREMIESADTAIQTYSSAGLRTLVWAYRRIPKDEYEKWLVQYKQAANSIHNRETKVAQAASMIETNLKLVAVTAVEDLLQDEVPETIEKLRAGAGIKVWVLTGDKQGTAINIAKSCRLITDDMKTHILNVDYTDPAKPLDNPIGKAVAYVRNRQDVEQKLNAIAETVRGIGSEQNTLVVDGKTLEVIFDKMLGEDTSELQSIFWALAPKMVSVTCCRVSPDMKASVTRGMKNHPSKPVTLAIGDGANDVPMIQAAHVGIGIIGVEGRQAVQASDYAMGQFKFLQPLLFVHGRWNYIRNTYVVVYSFYKNLVFAPTQYWFTFTNAFSGQNFYFDVVYQVFNTFFTQLPIMAYGFFEQDVNAELSMNYPHLYRVGRESGFYNLPLFAWWAGLSLYQSAVTYYIPVWTLGDAIFADGSTIGSTWILGSVTFQGVIFIVNLAVSLQTKYWFWVQHLSVWISILMWFLTLLICSAIFSFSSAFVGDYQMAERILGSGLIWLTTMLMISIASLPMILYIIWQEYHGPYARSYAIKTKHAAELNSSIFNCGCCLCGCGDGCVNRAACPAAGDVDAIEESVPNSPLEIMPRKSVHIPMPDLLDSESHEDSSFVGVVPEPVKSDAPHIPWLDQGSGA